MALDTPTTKEISDNIVANISTELAQTVPVLPKAFIRVLAKTLAAIYVILYKYIGFGQLQQFVSTSSFSTTDINGTTLVPLIEWGRLVGVGDPVAATAAELEVEVTVTSQTGILASGSQLSNTLTGVLYITIGDISLDAPTKSVIVKAVNDQTNTGGTGSQGNMNPGETMTFVNPLPNVDRTVTVVTQTVTASDAETEEAYRQRVIDRFQKPPQGGSYADYELWAEEVPGIINAYPYTGDPGIVNVYSEATVASSGNPDGIPTAAQLQAVLDSINQADRRPANAFVYSLPITRTAFNVTVQGLVVENETSVKADIDAALTEYFLDRDPYIEGLSIPPRLDRITLTAVAGVVDDIVQLAGGFFEQVLLYVDGSPTPIASYVLTEGEKSKIDTVTYT